MSNNWKLPLQPNTTEFTDSAIAQTAKYNQLPSWVVGSLLVVGSQRSLFAKQTVNAALLGHYFTAKPYYTVTLIHRMFCGIDMVCVAITAVELVVQNCYVNSYEQREENH